VTGFAVTLPGASARDRQAAADQLAKTVYLRFGQQDRVNALFFRVPVAGVRAPDPARDLLEELIAGLPGDGPVQVNTAGLGKADACRVSQVLRDAHAASNAAILDDLRATWDRRHQVPSSGEDLAQFLVSTDGMRAAEQNKALKKVQKANQAARVKAAQRRREELAALVAARAGLVEEEAS
jgi:hypothetical protein